MIFNYIIYLIISSIQDLTGIDAETFNSSIVSQNAFIQTISESLNGQISTRDISITSIGSKTASSSSRRYLRDMYVQSTTAITQVEYAITTILEKSGFSDPSAAFNALKTNLTNAVNNPSFNILLRKIATSLKANDLLNVNASGVLFSYANIELLRTAAPSVYPVNKPGSSSGSSTSALIPGVPFIWSIVIIIVVALIVLGLIIVGWYYYGDALIKGLYKIKEAAFDKLEWYIYYNYYL